MIRKTDGSAFAIPAAENIFTIEEAPGRGCCWPSFLREETERVCARAGSLCNEGSAVLFVLADSHFTVNGNWEQTAFDMKMAAQRLRPDVVVHLGDLTDGLAPAPVTREIARRMTEDMQEAADRVFLCIGNHDTNYFHDNPDVFTEEEQSRIYLGRSRKYYYEDLPERQLRLFFLDSFDRTKRTNEQKYGFSVSQICWVRKALREMPEGYHALFFSHVPLLGRMHYWSREIRNGDRLLAVLNAFQNKEHRILACLNGHSHADQTDLSQSFPLIQIGCSKLESFDEGKPAGATVYGRNAGDASADLWDVLIIDPEKTRLDLIRFGAGVDRSFVFDKDKKQREERNVQRISF